MEILLLILALLFVLFLPGFVLSFLFFNKKTLDSIERLPLSFALSVAIVPIMVFYLNLLGIRITILTVTIQIALVILVALLLLLFKEIKK